jgi:GntR family transcriptional repressor for pyruvate dehydrogenase complex
MTMQFDKLNVLSAYQTVSRALRRLIDSGELKAGDQLPTEAELAQQFGVNRSTVREGIRQLENEGLVSRQGRKRLSVSVPGSVRIASQATRALVMRQVTFRELWEAALVLEPACAALSAKNRDDELVAVLTENIERTRRGLADTRQSNDLDTEFHALVTRGARNRALLLSREPIGLLLFPAFEILISSLPQAKDRMLVAHEKIVDAIQNADAFESENWMRKHIVDFRRGWEMAKLSLDLPIDLPRSLTQI